MRIFPRTIEVGPDEGFTPEKDIFKRREIGEGLTSLLTSTSEPLVLAINGPWGTGKSVFLKMWAGHLRQEGVPVIYFDAFEHDYVDDAFSAIAGEIIALADSKLGTSAKKSLKSAALATGKVLVRAGVGLGVRVATAGALGTKELEGVVDDAKEAVADATDKAVEEALTSRKKQREKINHFRETLSKLPSQLSSSGKPLVFIIDELDRCKPTFALALLERVKHFFAVSNVHFVFGVHIKQLENSISVTYGQGIDASLYLQKFISITANLDTPVVHHERSLIATYLNHLQAGLELKPEDQEVLHYTSEVILLLASYMDLSLRSLERVMSVLGLALAYTKKNNLRVTPILAGLCVMKVISPDLFIKAKRGLLTYREVEKYFGLDAFDPSNNSRSWPSEHFVQWWQYALKPDINRNDGVFSQYDGHLFSYSLRNRQDVVIHIANSVVDRFTRGKFV